MKSKALYRTPPDPGYIGGYNWTAMLTGFAVLLLSNVAATQFVAYRFGYQHALGAPLYRTAHVAFYQPFAWSMWVLRYVGSENLRIRGPVQIGKLIVMAGCGVAIALFYILNLRRTKALSKNSEDLHGSARWATEADVRATGPPRFPAGRVCRRLAG